jgi:hypothetical protein
LAIRKILSAKDIVCFVRKYDRSLSLVVMQKSYSFVEACVAFRSMLTPESLRFAYAAAGREFVERMSSLFIVLTDGGQTLPTFAAPTLPVTQNQPSTSQLGTDANAVAIAPVTRPNFLLQCLAPYSARKRPHDAAPVAPAPPKRVAL